MIELDGKYNSAIVYTDTVDNSTIGQIISICNLETYKDSLIRIMPDCHAGAGCVIGTTITIKDAITPNLVGVDIGCGMLTIKLKEKRIDLPALDSIIRKYVPSGSDTHDNNKCNNSDIEDLACIKDRAPIRIDLAYKSLGTLGGGNHFIEIDKDSATGDLYLIIHTGSRHLGLEVCNWYQNKAYEQLKLVTNYGGMEVKIQQLIEKLKSEGRYREIQKEIEEFKKKYKEEKPNIPFELAYCTGGILTDYLHDMRIVQRHASINRETIAKIILKRAKLHEVDRFETIHNYIDTENMILRKGAVSAQQGERLLIPINMRDGSLVCTGKGNPDWNFSAPHGAGRLFSRSAAKEQFSLSEYRKTMKEHGIFTTSIDQSTLDECPMAYKDMQSIIDNIQDTVSIDKIIKPIYNFKASALE